MAIVASSTFHAVVITLDDPLDPVHEARREPLTGVLLRFAMPECPTGA